MSPSQSAVTQIKCSAIYNTALSNVMWKSDKHSTAAEKKEQKDYSLKIQNIIQKGKLAPYEMHFRGDG